jgi:polycystin 2
VFELPATGGVVPSHVIRACKLLRYVSSFDYFILVCEFIFCAFVLYYFVEEAIEVGVLTFLNQIFGCVFVLLSNLTIATQKKKIKKHKLSYFKSVWNILDVVILIIAAICIGFNIYRQVTVSNLLEGLLQNDNQYVSLQFLCYWQNVFNTAVSIMVFLSWIKIFKYVSFNKTMTQLSMTLSRCAKDVTGFAIMFFIVFLAYAQLGYLVFGTQIHDFSTFSYSM